MVWCGAVAVAVRCVCFCVRVCVCVCVCVWRLAALFTTSRRANFKPEARPVDVFSQLDHFPVHYIDGRFDQALWDEAGGENACQAVPIRYTSQSGRMPGRANKMRQTKPAMSIEPA